MCAATPRSTERGWIPILIAKTAKEGLPRFPITQVDPRWSVIAGVFLTPHPSVNATAHKPVSNCRREQQMVEPHAFVLGPALAFVIPECPEWPFRSQLSQRVSPALRQQARKQLAAFRLNQRVVIQGTRRIYIPRRGHNVIISGQHRRGPLAEKSVPINSSSSGSFGERAQLSALFENFEEEIAPLGLLGRVVAFGNSSSDEIHRHHSAFYVDLWARPTILTGGASVLG